jgi:hypothetical protein
MKFNLKVHQNMKRKYTMFYFPSCGYRFTACERYNSHAIIIGLFFWSFMIQLKIYEKWIFNT